MRESRRDGCGLDASLMTATPSSRGASSEAAAPLVFGPYRTIEKVGAGATATVYRAIHTETNQMVAMKVILFNQSNAKLSRRL